MGDASQGAASHRLMEEETFVPMKQVRRFAWEDLVGTWWEHGGNGFWFQRWVEGNSFLSPSIRGNRWRIFLEPILGDEDHQWGPAN